MRNLLSDCHKLFSAFFPQIPIGHCCEYRAVLGVWCGTQLAVFQNIQYAGAMHLSTACQKIGGLFTPPLFPVVLQLGWGQNFFFFWLIISEILWLNSGVNSAKCPHQTMSSQQTIHKLSSGQELLIYKNLIDTYILLRYIIYNIEIARPCHQLNAVFCSVHWVIMWLHVCMNFVTFLNFPTTFPPLTTLATMMQTTTLATSATPTTTTSAKPMQWPAFLLFFFFFFFLNTNFVFRY